MMFNLMRSLAYAGHFDVLFFPTLVMCNSANITDAVRLSNHCRLVVESLPFSISTRLRLLNRVPFRPWYAEC